MSRKAVIPGLQARIVELEVKLNSAITEIAQLDDRLQSERAARLQALDDKQVEHDGYVASMKQNHREIVARLEAEHAAKIKESDSRYSFALSQITRQAEAIAEVHAMLDYAGAPPVPEGKSTTNSIVGRLGALFMYAALRSPR